MPTDVTERTESARRSSVPSHFWGIGYTRNGNGLPLESIRVPVDRPAPGEVLIEVYNSALNPLDYKLAQLNFLSRTPPVILGFDLAGVVVAVGREVSRFSVGDEVMALASPARQGGWGMYGSKAYANTPEYLTVKKTAALTFEQAGVLPMCFLAAFMSLYPHLKSGQSIYIPGAGGGVGHLAVQIAARVMGASLVIGSASAPASLVLAKSSGATEVFNYRTEETRATIDSLTDGRGVDVVLDATYSETGFSESAKVVKEGGQWIVLGVGPGKTTRTVDMHSAVPDILAARRASLINVNMLNLLVSAQPLRPDIKLLLQMGLDLAVSWAAEKRVLPSITRSIDATPEEITTHLKRMQRGAGNTGKISVRVREPGLVG